MEEKDKKEKFQFVKNEISSKKKMVTIGIISIVVIVAIIMFCTIFALTNINNTKIISGVKINNIDVSNLSQEEANEKELFLWRGRFVRSVSVHFLWQR